MDKNQAISKLIAEAILDKLTGTQFGLLIRSLPMFQVSILLNYLNLDPDKRRLALLGFNQVEGSLPSWIARDVETAITWRNDPDYLGKLIVILNPQQQFEKIHSLELLDPFTDEDLRSFVIITGKKHADANQNYVAGEVWKWLSEASRHSNSEFSITSTQFIDFYLANQSSGSVVGTALPYLGLLPDSTLKLNNVESHLRENIELKEWLSGLDIKTWASLSLARLPSNSAFNLELIHRKIRFYIDSATQDNLSQLEFAAIKSIKEAPKAVKHPTVKSAVREPADKLSIIQALKVTTQFDQAFRQQYQSNLEEQARRISNRYRIPFAEEKFGDQSDQNADSKDPSEDEDVFEPLYDVEDAKEIGRVKKYTHRDEDRHILHDRFEDWLQPDCWGGVAEIEVSEPEFSIYDLFDSDSPLQFFPSTPLIAPKNANILALFFELDEAFKKTGQEGRLEPSLKELEKYRRSLLPYRLLFLYYPQIAVLDPDINNLLHLYLQSYNKLAQSLQEVSRSLRESYPEAIQRALAGFMSLDTILVTVTTRNEQDLQANRLTLLTCLHPLHLWKWLQLSDYLSNTQSLLSSFEQECIISATSNLPTILNTFSLHPSMYPSYQEDKEENLVLSGELKNPENETTVGIPYYQLQAEQNLSSDGLKEFASIIRKFLALYPSAQLGLILVLIDPPHPTALLNELVDLHKSKNMFLNLEAARVYIFRNKTSNSLSWSYKDEESLQIFRSDPRWMLSEHPVALSLTDIHKKLEENKVFPHIVLICDPSTAVAYPTFRSEEDPATPFGVPVHLTYDKISDSVKIVPAATGGLFDSYANLNNILSGDLHRRVIGIGNRNIKPEDLSRYFTKLPVTHWLAVLDWPQGTLEMPSNVGRRLLWQAANSRTLSIHSSEQDWEKYWLPQLKFKLNDWHLSTDPDWILAKLLELTPLLPNGLLDLIKSPTSGYVDILNDSKFGEMLGLIVLMNWYHQQNPNMVLLPISGDDFKNWYGETLSSNSLPPYYMVLWTDENTSTLNADIISLNTTKPKPQDYNLDEELKKLAAFAKTFVGLFENSVSPSILTPLRRASLRSLLISNVFSPSSAENETTRARQREMKAHWANLVNDFFAPRRSPKVNLTVLRVILDDESLKHASRKIQSSLTEELSSKEESSGNVEKKELILFGGWLQPQQKVSVSAVPNLVSPVNDDQVPPEDGEKTLVDATGANDAPISDIPSEKPASPPFETKTIKSEWVIDEANRLRRVLDAYSIPIVNVELEKSQVGPRFVRFWVQLQPPAGRLIEVQKYADDIAREMGSRVVPFIENIPGERYIGIDLERIDPQIVPLKPALDRLPPARMDQLPVLTGQDVSGQNFFLDFVKYPHLLVAGQTGSGKTIFLSSLVLSLAWRHSPKELQIILVDPKQMDFVTFGDVPHLWDGRVLFEPDEAIEVLKSLLEKERPRRVEIMRSSHCPNNLEYNRRFPQNPLPWTVVVIDEFADLILNLSKRDREEFERQINRLAATGRAIGIHLVIATQRPTTDIITGTIKANIATRISFRLPSGIDSRTILDCPGAENLLGQGDMLLSLDNQLHRLQAYYASVDEYSTLLARLKR